MLRSGGRPLAAQALLDDMDPAATTAAATTPHPEWRAVWAAFAQAYTECVAGQDAADEDAFRRELVFCLLGGHGITYELSVSTLAVVDRLDIFAPRWSRRTLAAVVEGELIRPQFEPRRKDGSLRRYRFPRRKAKLIAAARDWVLAEESLTTRLDLIPDEQHRRKFLCTCPGFGPKTASWLLRNTGYAANLAVLDVHVLRAMIEHGRIGAKLEVAREYEAIEREFLTWCDELGAQPDAFDLFLWEWQRGTLRPRSETA
jgi:thermostable 8-oxoguanine DNA glycosylase